LLSLSSVAVANGDLTELAEGFGDLQSRLSSDLAYRISAANLMAIIFAPDQLLEINQQLLAEENRDFRGIYPRFDSELEHLSLLHEGDDSLIHLLINRGHSVQPSSGDSGEIVFTLPGGKASVPNKDEQILLSALEEIYTAIVWKKRKKTSSERDFELSGVHLSNLDELISLYNTHVSSSVDHGSPFREVTEEFDHSIVAGPYKNATLGELRQIYEDHLSETLTRRVDWVTPESAVSDMFFPSHRANEVKRSNKGLSLRLFQVWANNDPTIELANMTAAESGFLRRIAHISQVLTPDMLRGGESQVVREAGLLVPVTQLRELIETANRLDVDSQQIEVPGAVGLRGQKIYIATQVTSALDHLVKYKTPSLKIRNRRVESATP